MGAGGPALAGDDATPAALEYGRWLFAQDCQFVAGAASLAAIPASDLPEVAVAGRSNVGKSSLVNALTGRRTLARTSQAPGRTRQLNFFELGGRLMLVDLPGYGFARAPKSAIAAWTELMAAYLSGRRQLRRVLLLVDARRGLGPADAELLDLAAAAGVVCQAVLTKADRLSADALADCHAATVAAMAARTAGHREVAVTSARRRTGLAALRAEIAALAPDQPPA